MLKIKRAYEPRGPADGRRILIDRLWPRGLSKADAHIDIWLKELAPSSALRLWFKHDPQKWDKFREKYLEELSSPEKSRLIDDIAQHARHHDITLVYSARDTEYNDAIVLEEMIEERMAKSHV